MTCVQHGAPPVLAEAAALYPEPTVGPACQLLIGAVYLSLYLLWVWLWQTSLDIWARRRVGELLGVRIVWVKTGPSRRSWLWGASRPADAKQDDLVVAIAVVLWWVAAVLPVASMIAFILGIDAIPNRLAIALLLLSLPMMAHFFSSLSTHSDA